MMSEKIREQNNEFVAATDIMTTSEMLHEPTCILMTARITVAALLGGVDLKLATIQDFLAEHGLYIDCSDANRGYFLGQDTFLDSDWQAPQKALESTKTAENIATIA